MSPLCSFNAHGQRLFSLCPIVFETTVQQPNEASTTLESQIKNNSSLDAKIDYFTSHKPLPLQTISKHHCLLLTIGRALSPFHEDMYLTSTIYRLDALKNYANCLIWCAWDCNDNMI